MNVLIVEPFLGGSHKKWAEGFQKHSKHKVELMGLSAHHWKWRMRIGAVELAKQFNGLSHSPDVIIASDMLDLAQFKGLTKHISRTKFVLYMHENQITYPWSPTDKDISLKRDFHYGFINFTSCLAADEIWFNSAYHKSSFLSELPKFLKQFPDHHQPNSFSEIEQKSRVIPVGIETPIATEKAKNAVPRILWNHRWEYDKNPKLFFDTLKKIKAKNIPFELVVLGESGAKHPEEFDEIESAFKMELIHLGYTESATEYQNTISSCDILPVTSNQDFFGISVVEAILAGCLPLLPERLAYPEHIPAQLHQNYLWKSDKEFEQKLTDFLLNPAPESDLNKIQLHCNKYIWPTVAESMDMRLNTLIGAE